MFWSEAFIFVRDCVDLEEKDNNAEVEIDDDDDYVDSDADNTRVADSVDDRNVTDPVDDRNVTYSVVNDRNVTDPVDYRNVTDPVDERNVTDPVDDRNVTYSVVNDRNATDSEAGSNVTYTVLNNKNVRDSETDDREPSGIEINYENVIYTKVLYDIDSKVNDDINNETVVNDRNGDETAVDDMDDVTHTETVGDIITNVVIDYNIDTGLNDDVIGIYIDLNEEVDNDTAVENDTDAGIEVDDCGEAVEEGVDTRVYFKTRQVSLKMSYMVRSINLCFEYSELLNTGCYFIKCPRTDISLR